MGPVNVVAVFVAPADEALTTVGTFDEGPMDQESVEENATDSTDRLIDPSKQRNERNDIENEHDSLRYSPAPFYVLSYSTWENFPVERDDFTLFAL